MGVEELEVSRLNPIEHLWDKLEWRIRAKPSNPTLVFDPTNVLLEEWQKIPINTLQNLVEEGWADVISY